MRSETPLFQSCLRVIFSLLLSCVVTIAVLGGTASATVAYDSLDDRIEPDDWVKVAVVRVKPWSQHPVLSDDVPDLAVSLPAAVPDMPVGTRRAALPPSAPRWREHTQRCTSIRAPPGA